MNIISKSLIALKDLNDDFELVVYRTISRKKVNKNSIYKDAYFLNLSDESNHQQIDCKRKDKRYASFVVEMYAIIEQTLEEIYEKIYWQSFRSDENAKKINKSIRIENALQQKIKFEISLKGSRLIKIRNCIVHKKYSLKKSKKVLGIDMRSKNLIRELLDETTEYLNSIKK